MVSKGDERNRVIYEKCQAGVTYQALADEYGVSRQRIEQIYRQHGGRKGRKPKPQKPGTQGERLRLIRERLHGLHTQAAFAARLEVEPGRYGHWESGVQPIPTDQAKKIKDITPGITGDYIFWGDTRGLSIETFRKLQSLPPLLDKKRLAQIKKACIAANGKDGATIETVLKAVSSAMPDATGEEISAVIEELGKQAEFALRFSKQVKDDPQLLADFRKDT